MNVKTNLQLNNKTHLKVLRDRLNAALKSVGEESGLTFDIGNIRFEGDGSSCAMRVQAIACPDGKPVNMLEKNFRDRCIFLNLEPNDFGREFVLHGSRYKIAGMKGGRSYKLLVTKPGSDALYGIKASMIDVVVAALHPQTKVA